LKELSQPKVGDVLAISGLKRQVCCLSTIYYQLFTIHHQNGDNNTKKIMEWQIFQITFSHDFSLCFQDFLGDSLTICPIFLIFISMICILNNVIFHFDCEVKAGE